MPYLTLLLLSITLLFTSCSIKNDHADFHGTAARAAATPTRVISLEVEDVRAKADIGYIKNILGMRTGRIISKTAVSSVLYESTIEALAARAVAVAPSHLKLSIKIDKCFATYSTGLFITRANANITLKVNLVNEQGNSLYQGVIKGEGIEKPVFFYSGKNTGAALSKALDQALNSLCKEILPYIAKKQEHAT